MERNNSNYSYARRQGGGQIMITPHVNRRPPMAPRENVPNSNTQNDELIKYIKEAWLKVTTDNGPHGAPIFYRTENDTPHLPGFIPFDLEGFWGQRLVQNIHITQGQHVNNQ